MYLVRNAQDIACLVGSLVTTWAKQPELEGNFKVELIINDRVYLKDTREPRKGYRIMVEELDRPISER